MGLKHLKILSWNVNGIRSVFKKGFLEWLKTEGPDILCLQETKAHPDQLPQELLNPEGYFTYWHYPQRKGYSGVAVFAKIGPLKVGYGLGEDAIPDEGRALVLEYPDFLLYNIYFPNGKMNPSRLAYKMAYYKAVISELKRRLRRNKHKTIIVCGDFNTAHKEIDLARPKENSMISGFLPEERALIDELIDIGMVDAFRHFNKDGGNYTWWSPIARARQRNVGWRIDYFFIDKASIGRVKDAYHLPDVMGSDHCPVGILLSG